MTGPRDWDKELAEIDKLMTSPAPKDATRDAQPGTAPVRGAASTSVTRPVSGVTRPVTVWLIALLGPVGAAGLSMWPYPKACGLSLGVYLVGLLAVLGAAIWAMRTAWRAQRGLAMVIGTLTLLTALGLAAIEILPRVGYARHSLTWTCST